MVTNYSWEIDPTELEFQQRLGEGAAAKVRQTTLSIEYSELCMYIYLHIYLFIYLFYFYMSTLYIYIYIYVLYYIRCGRVFTGGSWLLSKCSKKKLTKHRSTTLRRNLPYLRMQRVPPPPPS